jgi:hypothetical protein
MKQRVTKLCKAISDGINNIHQRLSSVYGKNRLIRGENNEKFDLI